MELIDYRIMQHYGLMQDNQVTFSIAKIEGKVHGVAVQQFKKQFVVLVM